eukprot:Plantae.Rhodophyta-Purpureofilum_apyrenoidigerum.ctg1730.p1 GENE.Plantae.Rhodophyta-Purpureofilum_apyrenoidigerum.ctg1730~~Plantae.Rhodophyta-Purpureofilum_apyrenoidigerum.ctg1730.p1  ORF type:complete len:758 (+),score=156.19 Plantae.Rhodophyta-Purpureofilum_apyrenoidigerum.ctg1730:490-2763(+)
MAADSATSGLVYTAVIGIVVFIILYIVFELVRNRHPEIFQYRKFLQENSGKYPELVDENGGFPELVKPLPSRKFFGWLSATRQISNDEIAQTIGFDAVMMLIALRNKVVFFFGTGLLAAAVLLPVYATAGNNSPGIGRLTLSNLPTDSWRFWLVFVVDFFFAYAFLFYVLRETREYSNRREQYRAQKIGANYVIAVQDLPKEVRSCDDVKAAFEAVFPGEVEGVHMVYKSNLLSKKIVQYAKIQNKREGCEWTIINKDRRPEHRPKMCSCCCTKPVDSLEYYSEEQSRLEEEISSIQDAMDGKQITCCRTAIVIFRSKKVAAAASQVQVFTSPVDKFKITRLDSFRAVHWPGLRKTRYLHILFKIHTWAWMVVFLVFWGIIVAFAAQSLANLSQLGNIPALSWLEPIVTASPFLLGFLEGFLPPIVVLVLTMLPPILLAIFVSLEAIPSQGLMNNKQRNMVFIFLFFVRFVYVVLAGTALTYLNDMINNPQSIVNRLASGIPEQSGFFLNLLLASCFIGNAIALSQIVRVVVQKILKMFFKTPRQKKAVFGFGAVFGYAGMYGAGSLNSAIAIIYSTISPLLMFAAGLYFLLTYIVTKHNLCFTMCNPVDNGGSMFYGHIHVHFVALYIKQLCMIGLFGLNKSPGPAVVSVINLIPIIYCHLYIIKRFQRLCWEGSFEYVGPKAGDMDVNPVYVEKYITPELRKVPNGIPELRNIPELKVVRESGQDIETGAGMTKASEAPEEQEFYDAQINDKIET